jgi:hypothetical protein
MARQEQRTFLLWGLQLEQWHHVCDCVTFWYRNYFVTICMYDRTHWQFHWPTHYKNHTSLCFRYFLSVLLSVCRYLLTARADCACWLYLLAVRADCTCRLFLLTVRADCTCRLYLLTVRADCTCCLYLPTVRAYCTCRMYLLAVRADCTCRLYLLTVRADCTCWLYAHSCPLSSSGGSGSHKLHHFLPQCSSSILGTMI